MIRMLTTIFTMCAMFVALPAMSATIYVWDNDAGSDYEINDPETGALVGCEFAIERALTQGGHDFDSGMVFPFNADYYDVIFIAMGYYC